MEQEIIRNSPNHDECIRYISNLDKFVSIQTKELIKLLIRKSGDPLEEIEEWIKMVIKMVRKDLVNSMEINDDNPT